MRRNRVARPPKPLTSAQVLALAPFAWWKAGDLALADGAAVSSWADASGNSRTATQATGTKQPTFVASGLGGLPAVRFSAANVSALATATFTAFTQATVFIVAKAPATTPSATQYLIAGISSTARRDLTYNTTRTLGVVGTSAGPVTKSFNGGVTAPGGTGLIGCGIWDGASGSLRHDSIPTAGDTGGDVGNAGITIGARNGQTASYDGDISEILYFNRRLTAVQIMGVERYLAKKYGVPLTQAGVTYVNSSTGSDTANTGRSPLSPLATITKAHAVLGSLDGRIEATGTFREALNITTTGKRLIKLDAATWYGSERHTSGWTAVGGGIYSKAVTGYSTSLTHMRVVSDLDADGFWTTLTPSATPTTPAAGECGLSASTLYVHLAGGADPNTKIIEAPKYDSCFFSRTADEHVIRGSNGSMTLCANRANVIVGSAGTDGRVIAMDMLSAYGGDLGCHATQNDATSFKRYRCETYRAMNDGGNWHGTTGRAVQVYSEDCNDHHNYDEGESAHDNVVHTVRGGWKHHNVGGGGITNVMSTVLDADGSAAGPLICENNRTDPTASPVTDQGGISIYDSTASGTIGAGVVCRNNRGSGIYVNPGSTGSTVAAAAKTASTGNALPDTTP